MFLRNINRKAIALVTAIVIWIFVNQSITETKTIPNVPIKVINLPSDKTILGLLPNGYLSQRVTLTLSGSKDVVNQLEQGDLEVQLDAKTADSDDWVVVINKKNIVSLNPSLDLRHHINNVSHPDFVIKLSKLVTEKVPIRVLDPTGNPPAGYEFLDIWPETLLQTLSGPLEEIQDLKIKGLTLTLDLSKISKQDLDALKNAKKQHGQDDEISFFIPYKWKKIPIPFRENAAQEINDPAAENLRMDFLKKRLLPVGKEIPITIYYPLKHLDTINPSTQRLATSEHVHYKNGVALFSLPLYVRDVSRLFLDVIRDHIEIVIVAAPKNERESLQWSVEVIDTHEMEGVYVAYVIANQKESGLQNTDFAKREEVLRRRFQDYMHKLSLYTADGEKLNLKSFISDGEIHVGTE